MKRNSISKNNKYGFTMIEVIVVLAILAILSTITIPSFLGFIDKSKETVCNENRNTLARMLTPLQLSTQSNSLEQVAASIDGKALISGYTCPSEGEIYVVGNTVKCTFHSKDGDDVIESVMLSNAITNLGNNNINWQNAVKKLADGNSNFSFSKVDENVIRAYKEASSNNNNVNIPSLTWKPAVTTDGSCVMIASTSTKDQQAIDNAFGGGSAGYDSFAYIIYNGNDYYGHFHSYLQTTTSKWVSDNSLNLQNDIYNKTNEWKKLTISSN